MMRKNGLRGAAVLALGLVMAACGGEQQPGAGSSSESIAVDGSSTVFPISEAAAEAFSHDVTGGARVTVGESGTGGGFRKFCRGEIQIQGASRPISAEEMTACAGAGVQYVEVPIALDGLTVVVNPAIPVRAVTIAQLRRIWEPAAEGVITNWRQVDPSWPNQSMQLLGAGTASGTFDFFTEAVVGAAKSSRTDYTPTEDDNVTVQGVVGNAGAMGYFGFAYYEQNAQRLAALAIDGVEPNLETIASGAYPLARPVFIYISAEALRRPAVQRFAQYYVANAGRLARQVGYVPLSDAIYEAYAQRVREAAIGTAFGGHQEVGADVSEVVTRPLSSEASH